jgi:hypothetical protein
MFIETKQNIEPDAIEFFERFLRAEDRDPWRRVIQEALPVLNKVEKEGGRIDMSIKHYDSTKISSGSCLFSEHPDGHFSFLDEFLDGFDDYYEFKVMKMHKDEKKKKEEEEAWMDQYRAKWRAKQGPANEVVLKEAETLADQPPELLKDNSVVPE